MASATFAGGNNSYPFVSLYNDSNDGSRIALMAVMAWSSAVPPIVWGYFLQGQPVGGASVTYPLVAGNPVTPGVVNAGGRIVLPTLSPMYQFRADGITPLALNGAPLAVIPSGWHFEVAFGYTPNGIALDNTTLTVTFIWVPY